MKIILTALLITISLNLLAQEKKTKDSTKTLQLARNEVKLNLLSSVLSLPEINYERILKNNTSFGLAVFVGFENVFKYNYGIIPYYRVYFGKSENIGAGLFIEANAGIVNLESDYYSMVYTPQGSVSYFKKGNVTNYGMGFATGAKFLTKKNFVGEIYLGAGRFFGDYGGENAYPRIGVTIGKRF